MTSRAQIQVDAQQVKPHRINPYMFGHFVEDIRDHMDAMLAYVLRGMDFEELPAGGKGVSGGWYPVTNGKNTGYSVEPPAPGHSGHAQKIKIWSDDCCYGGIAQRVSIRGAVKHRIRIVARACAEIQEAVIEVADVYSREVLGSARIPLTGHDWHTYETELTPSRDCDQAEFRILISSEHASWNDSVSTGSLWLDHLSMLSGDRVGIVKGKVAEMARELNSGMMRLGGNYISAYHWEQGVGDPLKRPNVRNEAWNVMANKYFGTDEFIAFCRALGTEPLICVNDGSGTPEEAARWVEYCNGAADTPMGALRAANGHAEPYGVKFWEIGNEVWGPWQVGHCTAEQFANRYLSFARAMKAADPGIKLLACGHTDLSWNETVLEIAGSELDYLTMHIYLGYRYFNYVHAQVPKEEKYRAMVSFPEVSRHWMEKTEALLRSRAEYRHVKLAVTEHNTMYYPNTIRKGLPNEHTLEAAVANAAHLNEFIRKSDLVEIGSFSDLVNGWLGGCIRVGDDYSDQYRGRIPGWSGKSSVIYGTPAYYAMKLYANRDIAHVIGSAVQCGTYQVDCEKTKDWLKDLPVLDAVACMNDERDAITLFVVNRDVEDIELDLDINGMTVAADAVVHEISGDHIDSLNDVHQPEAVTIRTRTAKTAGNRVSCKLRAHSIYAFELRRDTGN